MKFKLKPDLLLLIGSIVLFLFMYARHSSSPVVVVAATSVNIFIALVRFWEERRVALDFVISVRENKAILKIANYGQRLYTITHICFRTEDGSVLEDEVNVTVSQGDSEFDITKALTKAVKGNWDDVEISLRHNSLLGHARSKWKPFSAIAHNGHVTVSLGFRELRDVTCPKCGRQGLFSPAGLNSLKLVHKRRDIVGRQLKSSCPAHAAEWLKAMAEEEGVKRFGEETGKT